MCYESALGGGLELAGELDRAQVGFTRKSLGSSLAEEERDRFISLGSWLGNLQNQETDHERHHYAWRSPLGHPWNFMGICPHGWLLDVPGNWMRNLYNFPSHCSWREPLNLPEGSQ